MRDGYGLIAVKIMFVKQKRVDLYFSLFQLQVSSSPVPKIRIWPIVKCHFALFNSYPRPANTL